MTALNQPLEGLIERVGQSGLGRRERRLISRSTASRMKSERFSFSANNASMRASVPSGKRAGVCSSLIFTRPTGRFVPDITNSGKSCDDCVVVGLRVAKAFIDRSLAGLGQNEDLTT